MYKILIATDGSEHANNVVEETVAIAEAKKAEVIVMTVIEKYFSPPRVFQGVTEVKEMKDVNWDQINRHMAEEAKKVVEKAAQPFKDKGLNVKTEVLSGHKSPADAICEMSQKENVNLVVMGNRGLKGIGELFLGSVSNKVAHCTGANVLIIK